MTRYAHIVFMQGDDYDEWEAIMYPDREPGYLPLPRGHDAAVEYLAQWDNGDEAEVWDTDTDNGKPWGTADYTYEQGEYVMSWNPPLGYVGLVRKLPARHDWRYRADVSDWWCNTCDVATDFCDGPSNPS
jgi:hypothetical protein